MRIQIREAARRKAKEFGLPINLVTAIVQAESAGNRYAFRPEPGYRWLWNVRTNKPYTLEPGTAKNSPPSSFPHPRGVTKRGEFDGQRTSWGLMQIMGAVAREYGFAGTFFTELCDVETGLHYGCMHLSMLIHSRYANRDLRAIAAAYNAGSPRKRNGQYVNQGYVDKIARLGGFV